MMIGGDGSVVAVLMTIKTVIIKNIQFLSERSLTQYSPHLTVCSQPVHRWMCRRKNDISLSFFALTEIVSLLLPHFDPVFEIFVFTYSCTTK